MKEAKDLKSSFFEKKNEMELLLESGNLKEK
jgi:hypothetical protein